MTHKKQAFNLIESICKLNNEQWNNKAGSYDDKKEAEYQIEEALEGFNMNLLQQAFANNWNVKADEKAIARALLANVGDNPISDVDRFDKVLDSIYFSIGAMHKLGLSPEQMIEGLQIVHNGNISKSGKKDENGKVIKSKDFLEPEPLLQKILDNRKPF